MPRALTSQFGTIEYAEEAVLVFPAGLPGFEFCRRFVLLEQPALSPLVHLQSLEVPDLCFLALPVAPVGVNFDKRVAVQSVRADRRYSHAARLGAACS